MRSADRLHSPAPEELMAYVDGEGSADARASIEAHLATCAACQAMVADQRRLTDTMHAWQVAPVPASLQPPSPRAVRAWWKPSRTVAAGLSAAAVILLVVAIQQRARKDPSVLAISVGGREAAATAAPPARSGAIGGLAQGAPMAGRAVDSVAAAPEVSVPQAGPRRPSVIRTARLHIVTKEFTGTRESLESIVNGAAGFVDLLTVTGDTTKARVLRGTLRVPSDRLTDVLTGLRRLGVVLEDTQGTQDVTDQLVDLDARMTSARATERRLIELLRTRTGRLADVLEIERELTRVRLDIERLDAEKTNMTRRVSYATIEITVSEERKESLDGPISLTTRLRIAALDGVESALDSIAFVMLLILRAGPALLVWGTLATLTWLAVRRFAIRDSPSYR